MDLADRLQAECSTEEADPSASVEAITLSPRLPSDVVLNILALCEPSAANAIVRSCREYHHLGTPFLYGHVKVYTPQQLHLLAVCVQAVQAGSVDHNNFRFTSKFTYALTATSDGHYTALEHMSTFPVLATIPSKSLANVPIFPKLTEAFFYPLPTLDTSRALADPSNCFLHSITRLHLLWTPHTIYSDLPTCHSIGMTALQSISLHHLMGGEAGRWPTVRNFFGFQQYLTRLEVRLEEHSSHFLNPSRNDSVIIQSGLPYPISDDTGAVVKTPVYEYAMVIAHMLHKTVYRLNTGSRTNEMIWRKKAPNLQEVIVNLPSRGNRAMKDCLEQLADRCRRRITSIYKNLGYPYRCPDLVVRIPESREQEGSEWILRGDRTLEEYRQGFEQLWGYRELSTAE